MSDKLNDVVEDVRETAVRTLRDVMVKLAERKRKEADKLRDNANQRRDQDDDLANTVPKRSVDSRGRVIPEGVQRLPSGKLPSNWHYAGKVYDGDRWTAELKRKYPNGVRFTDDGYPDFSPYAEKTTKITPHFDGNHTTDFSTADRAAGVTARHRRENELTWHHHQDGTTLLLVPREIHDAVRHAGGVAIAKGRS
jgi:hypothetical protein